MTTLDEGETALDQAALDGFADRMIGVLNDGCTALMTSIGHQTGLFGTLATSGPATSAQVAEAGGLNERYVREWLNAMTTARFVRYDPESRTYTLPREHAAWLVDDAGPDNLARTMTYLPMFAEVEQGIVQCFRKGGGLSYADYPRFTHCKLRTTWRLSTPHCSSKPCPSWKVSTGGCGQALRSPTSAAVAGTRSTC